jgi:hypothetical protein
MMQFSLVDYSSVYYELIVKQPRPERRAGKFIIMACETEAAEYLVMSPRELSAYHANIAERFCVLNRIAGRYNSRKDLFHIDDPEWTVAGGGLYTLDDTKKVVEFYGESLAYGAFDAAGLGDKIRASGILTGYDVVVR